MFVLCWLALLAGLWIGHIVLAKGGVPVLLPEPPDTEALSKAEFSSLLVIRDHACGHWSYDCLRCDPLVAAYAELESRTAYPHDLADVLLQIRRGHSERGIAPFEILAP
jgi:hypothetical protein